MARPCIICGKAAGSREHLFPAALGGRRTNKGIYCGEHNQGFSPLAKILSDQFEAINAILSVRPDHSDEPRRVEVSMPDGVTYAISGNDVRLAQPQVLKEKILGESTETSLRFSDEQQIQTWIAQQRAAGLNVRITNKQEGQDYFLRPIPISSTLGGAKGLRAIGYIALTFFSHYFPAEARQPGMVGMRDFVQEMNDEERVWWENPDSTTGLPPNPFQFGHTIALAIDASGGDAYALVSLFSTVNFAVQLGHVKSQSDSTVVVHIDPHAERPPSDIQDIRRNSIIFNIQKPLNSTDNLNDMISTGRAQQDLQLLVARITKWNAERATRPIFDELISIRNLGHDERKLRIKAIIDT